MTFMQVFSDLISTIANLVTLLFSMEFLPSVSFGSIMLYIIFLYIIVRTFYTR